MGWKVRGSDPGKRFPAPVRTEHGAHPASYTMRTMTPSRRQSDRGVALTIDFHPAPGLKKEHSCKSTCSVCLHGRL